MISMKPNSNKVIESLHWVQDEITMRDVSPVTEDGYLVDISSSKIEQESERDHWILEENMDQIWEGPMDQIWEVKKRPNMEMTFKMTFQLSNSIYSSATKIFWCILKIGGTFDQSSTIERETCL